MQANAQTFDRVSVVRGLQGRKVPSSIAHAFSPSGAELVVVERYAGLDAATLEKLEADARTTMSLRHPNVATVRDVWREKDELCVATEYVEGESLEELRKLGTGDKALSIEVGVRVVVDVLAALSAIHTLGSGLAHGEVSAMNAIVGFDGVTRLVRPYRGRVAGKTAEPDWFSYAAPEVVKGGPADVRADLYGVGVLLWETLSRRKLFPKATREGRAARTMPVGKPSPPPEAGWAAPLAAVAERALANDPAARYTTAAEMAAAVRLAVRSKLAMPPRVSAAVDKLAGEKVLARRTANALPEAGDAARVSVRPSRPPLPAEATRALASMRRSSRPPTPKPGAVAGPTIPKQAPLPAVEASAPVEAKPLQRPPTGPRPFAPNLKLADVKPKEEAPPPSAEPISVNEAFAEEEGPTKPLAAVSAAPAAAAAVVVTPPPAPVKPPPPAVTPPPAAPISEPTVARAEPEPVELTPPIPIGDKRKGRVAMIIAAGLVALIAIGAVVRIALTPSSDPKTTTAHAATGTATATVTATATATVTTTATATTTASIASPTPSDSASAPEPETSATSTAAPPEGSSRRSHPRPRPTYDPMGI